MKQQLMDVHQIVRVVDPELMSYLEARDSANFYFCFRWLLVRFKRELSYSSCLRYVCRNVLSWITAAFLLY